MQLDLNPVSWGILILLGSGLGLLTGTFRAAGALALSPVLLAILTGLGTGHASAQIAAATAIAIQIPLSFAQGVHRRLIDLDSLVLLAPAAIMGTAVAALCQDVLIPVSSYLLVCAGPALAAAYVLRTSLRSMNASDSVRAANPVWVALKMLAASVVAALSGVSINIMAFNILRRLPNSSSTGDMSSALSLVFAIAATVAALLTPVPQLCGAACAGTLHLPALAAIGMMAVLTVPLGLRVQPAIQSSATTRVFMVLVIAGSAGLSITSGAVSGFVEIVEDTAIDSVLGPLCDPPPKPSSPALGKPDQAQALAFKE
jgi:uncharacterized membrane protein YfcA